MVSFKRYLALSFMFTAFLFLSCITFALSILDYDTEAECQRNCPSGTCLLTASTGKYICRLSISGGVIGECTSGQTQYQPKGDCGTSERSCCSDGTWSDWDGECSGASSCGLNECWNGSTCVSKPSSTACTCNNGTCSLTYRCVSGSGWKSTKNCTCDSGYEKNSSGECVHSSCTQSCSSGKYRVEISSGLRAGQCDCCSPSGRQKKADGTCGSITTYIDCLSSEYYRPLTQTCCRKIDELVITTVYSLPSTYSSCSNWGSDMGWSMETTECCRDATSL